MTAQRTLLVVDDEVEIVRLVTRIFQARGMRVLGAHDGAEALASVASDRPDLVLLDLDLPRVDGWEVCRQLKADAATRDIPIVMMTAAHTTLTSAQRGLEVGANEYIEKPFLREVLVHNVERLLGIAATA